MSQYITRNKLSGSQAKQLLDEKDKIIADLQYNNNLLRRILSQVPGHIYWISKTGDYMGANDNVLHHFLGLTAFDEFIGKRHEDFFDPEIAAQLNQIDQMVINTGKEHIIEEDAYDSRTNNQSAIYLTKKSPLINDQGEIIGIIGVSFDITERKKMEHDLKVAKEKAEASDHAKSQFLAVMNHELSTPLASIIGLINLIKQGGISTDEENNIIDIIENSTHHLLKLVNEVLDFSKLEKGSFNVKKTFIDLNTLFKEVYDLLHITARNKGLELHIQCDPAINKSILADQRILLQILINLINNAIKFTDNGSITIKATVVSQTNHAIKLKIAIEDTGRGIPPDKIDLIFEPFQQLEDTYVRKSSRHGVGLGLAIVKKLADQLNLSINVTSTLGKGSTFFLIGEFEIGKSIRTPVIPLDAPTSALPVKKTSSKVSILSITAKKPRVLLIEDDPIIQFIHKRMFEEFKCRVDVVSHGLEALKILDQHDIVFVDISLPDISGFEVIKQIRKHDSMSNIPIVALTVHRAKKEKQECLDAGADKFTSKPVTKTQLARILMQYVVKKQYPKRK